MSIISKYISQLESGKGFVSAAAAAGKSSVKSAKKQLSKKEILENMFSGDDIFSAFIRGKLGVKSKKTKGKTPTSLRESVDVGGISADGITFLKMIAKNSIVLPGMARDMNVLRQNVVKLVKLKDKKSAVTKADDFFVGEEKRESILESGRKKQKTPIEEKTTTKEESGGSGLLGGILSFFSKGFIEAFKSLFSLKNIIGIFKKVFLPVVIIGTLFSGIKDGWKKYKETGNIGEAIISGLGGALEFLTFGIFGEDTLKSLWDSISNFLSPITDTISNIFNELKSSFLSLIGVDTATKEKSKDVKQKSSKSAKTTKPVIPDTKKYAAAPGKSATETSPTQTQKTESSSIVEKHKKEAQSFSVGSAEDAQSISDEISFLKQKRDYYSYTPDESGENQKIASIYDERINELTNLKNNKEKTPTATVAKSQSASTAMGVGGVASQGSSSGGSSTPSVSGGSSAPSGSELSTTSSQIAEGQRMESAADAGSVINSPVNNNNSSTTDQQITAIGDVYNTDFLNLLALT